jgi:predicted secreted acid phosphatase
MAGDGTDVDRYSCSTGPIPATWASIDISTDPSPTSRVRHLRPVMRTSSRCGREVGRVEAAAKAKLVAAHPGGGSKKAIVLDVDDTTLLNWNYEIASNWDYNPTTNAEFVTDQKFPAVFGMTDLVRSAQQMGYAIFFVTGRPAAQEPATLGNLASDGVGIDAGYPTPTALPNGEDGLFTKPDPAAYPDYLRAACADDPGGKCTTIHYKAATRAHIESLGYDIVLDLGDQDSDLKGGYADHTVKLPNPNYYLP